jgi:hypothetical protein
MKKVQTVLDIIDLYSQQICVDYGFIEESHKIIFNHLKVLREIDRK